MIAGFPTETDEMFFNTYDAVRSLQLTHLHVFPYSVRKGTPAAKMPNVPSEIIKSRAATLRDAGDREFVKLRMSQVGSVANVLIQKRGQGYSAHYIAVEVDDACDPGAIVNVRIQGLTEEGLRGETI